MKTVAIVGFGRFAKTLVRLFNGDFSLSIYSRRKHRAVSYHGAKFVNERDIFKSDVIVYAVSIRAFEEVVRRHAPHYRDGQTIIEVLSVKIHPSKVLARYVKNNGVYTLSTHPMFGPDSSKHGFHNLPMIMCPSNNRKKYNEWKHYFISKELKVVEMTPGEHDKAAAESQGLTHFLGRLLQQYGFKPTSIDSLGARKLKEIMDQVNNDTWQLYKDLQKYNPYSRKMVDNLEVSFQTLKEKTFSDDN